MGLTNCFNFLNIANKNIRFDWLIEKDFTQCNPLHASIPTLFQCLSMLLQNRGKN